ncbi:MAG: hypothetical protein WC623_24065 [Pedobacter sp.]|uniref:hypothetical protein n=1 Tax=Pedobacter sp. TaxID=1411316 RepID=UPI003567DE1C
MNIVLKSTIDMIREIKGVAKIKVHRGLADFLADRIVITGAEDNILKMVERLAKLLDAEVSFINQEKFTAFVKIATTDEGQNVLAWLREYPQVAAMIAMIKDEKEYIETLEEIDIPQSVIVQGQALPSRVYDIPMTIICLSPLAHGSDMKAGNATLFRKTQILSSQGQILNLPFYAGNAMRGQMRDLLADHFLKAMGLTLRRDNPPCSLWFFHALYAGGALEENATQLKVLGQKMGANGVIRGAGVYEFRNYVPMLSLLGVALGNRILSGKINVGDMRPCCREWGTGENPSASLFEWTYLTRREDHENHESGDNASMIANSECLKSGTILLGGIDTSDHLTEIEMSCLGMGLKLLQEKGYLGAENRRGFGQVKLEVTNCPDEDIYVEYLRDNKENIIKYLIEIGGINAPC